MKFAMGQAVSRIEDTQLLQGKGRYSDDVVLPGAAQAYVLRSPYAHARLVSVDTRAALAAPGVLAVLTGRDVEADGLGDMPCLIPMKSVDGTPRADTPRPILAKTHVHHVGDPIALVVAETLHQARDAAELIEIEYEELPSISDTKGAVAKGAPLAWPHIRDNVCFEWAQGDKAGVDAALGRAARVVRVELVNNRVVVNSMEPRSAIADYDAATGRSTLYTPTQGPHAIHGQIGDVVLKFGKKNLRIVTGHVGGSFGMKIFLYPEQPLVVWASRRLKRPVRWAADRSEAFLSDIHGRDNVSYCELGLDADGRFLGLRVHTVANLGAYLSNYGPFIPTYGTVMLAGVYKTPAIYVNVKGVMTNTVPIDAYRGAGRPEAIYLLERLIDVAAQDMNLAPDEIRRRNYIQPSDIPYKTALGDVYDSADFPAIAERCLARADWMSFPERRAESARRGMLRGIGMAYYIERCGAGPEENARIEVDPAGRVTLLLGMQDNGQGHATAHTQILSERLGIDASAITVVQGDTDRTPGGMTGGSRFAATGGTAVVSAADKVIAKGRDVAAHELEVAATDIEYLDGRFTVAGTDRSIGLFEAAAAARDPARLPAGASLGLDVSVTEALPSSTFPNGCHVAEVEVDPDTGQVTVLRYTAIDDFGNVINPKLLAGQVHGGIVQGLGQALHEHTVYDRESGQLLSATLMDYALPRAADVPFFDFQTHNIPCTTNLLGIKGAGEAGAIGAPPASINAVVDALRAATGLRHIDMPATPLSIWSALHQQADAA